MVKINYSLVAQTINGMSAIYISCMQFEQTALLDTHIRVFPDEWDEQSKTVVNNPNAQRLNLLMRKAIYEVESYELSRDNVQLHQLKLMWENKDISEDFYKIIKVELPNREIKKSTKQSHIDTFKLLKRYRKTCRVSELNEEWVKGFYLFVKS